MISSPQAHIPELEFSPTTSTYTVYLVRFPLTLQDPDMPGPRYHTTLLVITGPNCTGTIHHVTGDVTSAGGMRYTPRAHDAEETFHNFQKLGVTPKARYPTEWENLLGSLPTPPQQKAFNVKTMRTEPFKTRDPLMFYEAREERKPLVKCTEWVVERAIPALRNGGLLIE
ncbi:hypothetical protein BJX70DRAFT_245621 [Aspergillus crustosus]